MAITEGQGHKAKRVVVLIAAACLVAVYVRILV